MAHDSEARGLGGSTVLGICSVHGKALPVNSWKWRASHGDTEQAGIIL